MSIDPLGFAAGDANVARYVGNGATNATDPSGHEINLFSFGYNEKTYTVSAPVRPFSLVSYLDPNTYSLSSDKPHAEGLNPKAGFIHEFAGRNQKSPLGIAGMYVGPAMIVDGSMANEVNKTTTQVRGQTLGQIRSSENVVDLNMGIAMYGMTYIGQAFALHGVNEAGTLGAGSIGGGNATRISSTPHRPLLNANRAAILQQRAGDLTRNEIVDGITGLTSQGNRVAAAIRSGRLELNVLGNELFERAYTLKNGRGRFPKAFAYGEQIFVRRGSENILSEVVHEGTHGIDYISGFNGTTHQLEIRAHFFERQFQLAGGGNVEFQRLTEMLQHVRTEYH